MSKKILYILTFSFLATFSFPMSAAQALRMDCISPIEPVEPIVATVDDKEEASVDAEAEAEEKADAEQRDRIIDKAMKYLGTPYVHGTAGPRSFDCSGFTSYVFGKENISLSRCSRTQYTQGTPVVGGISNLRRGDLVFFGGSRATRTVGHVGIVVDVEEDGKSFTFVHAARGGVKVTRSNSSYYSRRYIGARRVI